MTAAPVITQDLVEVAQANGSFKTLVAAVVAAGLVDTLKGSGPFTIFAPTDAAFAKLPAGTVEALLQDLPKLTAILTYHVVPSQVMAADVVKLTKAVSVQGSVLKIAVAHGKVMINTAEVITADVLATNGVIHVIDQVLLPS